MFHHQTGPYSLHYSDIQSYLECYYKKHLQNSCQSGVHIHQCLHDQNNPKIENDNKRSISEYTGWVDEDLDQTK